LHKLGEILGSRLNTIHNLHYYQVLMAGMRGAIESGTFEAFKTEFAAKRASLSKPELSATNLESVLKSEADF
jgi:queuine tRNA-ribosyltransferase